VPFLRHQSVSSIRKPAFSSEAEHERRRRTPAQRDKILTAYRRGRLSQKEFAAQAGIGHSTLTLWLRQAAARKAGPSTFVPVPNLFSGAAAPAYRLQLPQGVTVEVSAGFRSEELGALLQLLQAL
jgi:transposase-like protein